MVDSVERDPVPLQHHVHWVLLVGVCDQSGGSQQTHWPRSIRHRPPVSRSLYHRSVQSCLIAALIFSAGYYSAPIFITTRRGVLAFSRFFLQEVDLFTRHFDLKAKVRKAVLVNRFSLSERSFLIMHCV